MLVCFVVAVVSTLGLRFYLIWENNKRDHAQGPVPDEYTDTVEQLSGDKTDREIPSYRYVY